VTQKACKNETIYNACLHFENNSNLREYFFLNVLHLNNINS
jgi:hypothetical protein